MGTLVILRQMLQEVILQEVIRILFWKLTIITLPILKHNCYEMSYF